MFIVMQLSYQSKFLVSVNLLVNKAERLNSGLEYIYILNITKYYKYKFKHIPNFVNGSN